MKDFDPKAEGYNIECTGDACVGDEVIFQRATFRGTYPNAKFDGYEVVRGRIIKDSYGEKKQQHTFTIELSDGISTRIKGRNLYREGVWRKPWANERARLDSLDGKHERGAAARRARAYRLAEEHGGV